MLIKKWVFNLLVITLQNITKRIKNKERSFSLNGVPYLVSREQVNHLYSGFHDCIICRTHALYYIWDVA